MTVEVTGRAGYGEAATISIPQSIASVELPAGTPIMVLPDGRYAPNDNVNPPLGYSPGYLVKAGQRFSPQAKVALVNPGGGYALGADYFLQPDNTVSSVPTNHYVGTAISKMMLVEVPETSAAVAVAAAPPDVSAIADQAPASATNKVLTENSFKVPEANSPVTILAGTGQINCRIKPNGVYVVVSMTDTTAAATVKLGNLPTPPVGSSYGFYIGVYNSDLEVMSGAIAVQPIPNSGDSEIVRYKKGTSLGDACSAAFFVPYI